MAFRLRHPYYNYRVLTAFTVVALPLLAIGSAVVLGSGQAQLRTSFGLQLSQVAEHTAAAVDAYVFRRIIDVSLMGRIPTLRQAAAEGSARPFDAAQVRRLDREWQSSHAVPAELAGILTNPAAALLRDTTHRDPIYREMLLTDRFGRLVAASNVTTDYDQADEDWWREAYDDGELGRVSPTDVRWDDSARAYALEIAVPVPEPDGERLAGVLKVVADVRELLASVASVEVGQSGEAQLIRPDGSIVFSRQRVAPDARFFASALLRERLQVARQTSPEYRISFEASTDDGKAQLIGVAPCQLGASYPGLSWIVAVSQSEDELFAPVRAQLINLLTVIGLTVIAVLILALWFSMRLSAPVAVGMDLVEHPRVHRIAEEDNV